MLPIAAVVITGLCVWRVSRPPRAIPTTVADSVRHQPAPQASFLLLDQHSKPVKLERYFGRQPLIVRFLGESNPESDPVLGALRERRTQWSRGGYEVVAVTTLPPSVTRKTIREAADDIPLLSDIVIGNPQNGPLHQLWGCIDTTTGTLRAGLFVVDREGRVESQDGVPRPVDDPVRWVERMFAPVDG